MKQDGNYQTVNLLKSNWENPEQYLENVKVGSETKVVFRRREAGKEIVGVSTSCGCTNAEFTQNEVSVVYKAQSIPKHLEFQNFYTTTKRIFIAYRGGHTEELFFRAKIIKK